MPTTPGYVSNSVLAASISALVDRWNTRENQMVALLTQVSGDVIVTDGLGVNHSLPSFAQLQADVAAMVNALSGSVAEAQAAVTEAVFQRNAAEDAADAAAASALTASTVVTDAAAQVTLATTQASNAAGSATAAAGSATAAAGSATTADTYKTAAAGSATAAAGSATTASGHASAASGSATTASGHATTASTAKVAAETARDKANLWANAPQNTVVEAGEYSAKHWAAQAQAAVTGTLVYMGAWPANSGAYPADPLKGHFYKVSVAGTQGGTAYDIGDQILHNGTTWEKIDNTEAVLSVAGRTGNVVVAKSDISGLQADLDAKAPLASPTFTGVPAAPTATAGTSTTQVATTAFVTTADALKASLASPTFTGTPAAPTATAGTSTTQLATTAFVTTADALKANLASPTFTGVPAAPTAAAGTNTTQLATTAFVQAYDDTAKANLASPTFTGVPAAPTAAAGTNTTQLATTAFVQAYHDVLKANLTGAAFTGAISATTVSATQNFTATGVNAVLAPGSAGTVWLRPGGAGVTTNEFAISTGGATIGGNSIWTAGNFDPATKVNTASVAETATGSTVVQRTAAGYVHATFFNTSAAFTGGEPTAVFVETGSDNYIRKQTMADFKVNLGLFVQSADPGAAAEDGDLWIW